jgi:hypothetical protein
MFMVKVTYKTRDQLCFYIKGSKLFLILRLSVVLELFPGKGERLGQNSTFVFQKKAIEMGISFAKIIKE